MSSRPLLHFGSFAGSLALLAATAAAAPQGLRITEYTYNSVSGEFIELTNLGSTPLNLAGWSIDDVEAVPGAYDLSAAGVLAVGASLVVTTEPVAAFRADWGVVGGVVLGDNDTAKLSRTDTIHVFNPTGLVVDRLEFGDEVFEYTVRTLHVAAYVCQGSVGANDPYGWRMAEVGDTQGSWASVGGDVGSPGHHVLQACAPLPLGVAHCVSTVNSSGAIAWLQGQGNPIVQRNTFTLHAASMPSGALGYAICSTTPSFIVHPGGSAGHLCLGGNIGRLVSTLHGANAGGDWDAALDLGQVPNPTAPIAAGESWYFQVWFRDANPTPGSNFTGGVGVNFH